MTSTTRSADSNGMSKVNTGCGPAVRIMPATSSASGAVTLNRASRPATSAQASSSSMMTTSASTGPPASSVDDGGYDTAELFPLSHSSPPVST